MITQQKPKSLRTFIGSQNYELSRSFYKHLGFEENIISKNLSLFTINNLSFYLQDYYLKEWVDNSMILLEVEDVASYWNFLMQLDLEKKYPNVRLIPIKEEDWGKECLLTDPSGVLWHFAEFRK